MREYGAPIWGIEVRGADLVVEQLVAGYGTTQVIGTVDLSLASGQRLALLGRNGAGKTTVLLAIMGLADQFGGRILLDGRDMSLDAAYDRARLGVGIVPQTRNVFRSLTVEQNLLAGLKRRPRWCVEEAYRIFPKLAERRHSPAAILSGGEQQMLSVARTLLGEPRLLLLDEPLEGLAPRLCGELMDAFAGLARDRQITVILVEQQIDRALDFADRVVIMERGQVRFAGSSAEARTSPALIERYVGVALPEDPEPSKIR
jgi:branched-chain amino acid transport system ATP-binding protein